MADAQKNLKIVIDWAQTGENIPGQARQQMEEIRKQSDLASSIGSASGMDQARKGMDFADMRKMTEAIKGGGEAWKDFGAGAEHSAHSMGRMLPMIGRMAGLPTEVTHSVHMLERMAMVFGPIGIAAAGAGLSIKYFYDQAKEAKKEEEETTKQSNEMKAEINALAGAYGIVIGKGKDWRSSLADLIQKEKDYIETLRNESEAIKEQAEILKIRDKYKREEEKESRKGQEIDLDKEEQSLKYAREKHELALKQRIDFPKDAQDKINAEKELSKSQKEGELESQNIAIKRANIKKADSIMDKQSAVDEKHRELDRQQDELTGFKNNKVKIQEEIDSLKKKLKDNPVVVTDLSSGKKTSKEMTSGPIFEALKKAQEAMIQVDKEIDNSNKKIIPRAQENYEGRKKVADVELKNIKEASNLERTKILENSDIKLKSLDEEQRKKFSKEGFISKEQMNLLKSLKDIPPNERENSFVKNGAMLGHLKGQNQKDAIRLGGKIEIVVRTPDGSKIGGGEYYPQQSDQTQTVTTDNAQNAGGYSR